MLSDKQINKIDDDLWLLIKKYYESSIRLIKYSLLESTEFRFLYLLVLILIYFIIFLFARLFNHLIR
jgi:hypothetical protein